MPHTKFYVFVLILLLLFAKCSATFSNFSYNNIRDFRSVDTNDLSHNEVNEAKGGADDKFEYLVVGGYRPTDKNLVKYIVSIRKGITLFTGANHICGGSILSEKLVLTAAHCFFEANGKPSETEMFMVFAGTPKRLSLANTTQIPDVDDIIIHDGFRHSQNENDIALIKLKESIELDGVSAAALDLPNSIAKPGTECYAIGWGRIYFSGPLPNEVLYGDLIIADHSNCRDTILYTFGMICANNPDDYDVDVCMGDSGGPLIYDNKVIGITSFGRACGGKDMLGYYTDVHYYRRWILENKTCRTAPNSHTILFILIIMTLWQFIYVYI